MKLGMRSESYAVFLDPKNSSSTASSSSATFFKKLPFLLMNDETISLRNTGVTQYGTFSLNLLSEDAALSYSYNQPKHS